MTPTVIVDYRPLWAILVCVATALLVFLTGKKRPHLREFWTIAASFLVAYIVYSLVPLVLNGYILEAKPFYILKGIPFHIKVDSAGMLFAALASGLWIVTTCYSIGYMSGTDKTHRTGYFAFFSVCYAAVLGIAFSGNLITFFIFYEILTLGTYPLVAHNRDDEAIKAGRKYLAYTLTSGQVFLIGILCIYFLTGTVEFIPGGFLSLETAPVNTLRLVFALLILGTAVKAGIMPFHGWLPAAMTAPTPVSALLHAVAVVKAGAFGVLRVVGYVFGPVLLEQIGMALVLAWFAACTIIIASLIAMRQDNLKRRLAFSTIGQLSYVVLGIALLTPLSILGAIFHIVAHALMKITLFFCAGAIFVMTDRRHVSELKGIGRQMPFTMAAFTIASLGIAGTPFFIGFISKWNLVLGALEAHRGLFILVLIASALLAIAYLIPICYMAFFRKNDKFPYYKEARPAILAPILITASLSIVLGLYPNFGPNLYKLAVMSAESITNTLHMIGGGW